MPKEIITIKDIAARAGVSTGTVDRVLHNRPNVSKTALDKVNKALNELDYRPNMYASALAYNKTYNFYIVLINLISIWSLCFSKIIGIALNKLIYKSCLTL